MVGRDRSAFAAVCALDVHYEDPLTGPALRGCDALGDHAARLWVAVPDAKVERAGERLSDGRFVAAPVRLSGTHSGVLRALPPTRRAFWVPAALSCGLDPPRERL